MTIRKVIVNQKDKSSLGLMAAGLEEDEVVEALVSQIRITQQCEDEAVVHFCDTVGHWQIAGEPRSASEKKIGAPIFEIAEDIVPQPNNDKTWYGLCTIDTTVRNTTKITFKQFSEDPIALDPTETTQTVPQISQGAPSPAHV
ncbi:MAG: hypothetical protein QF442_00730 [Candidatus Peribacteraceae bacterium]|jgi:hypothetical protein|nr:hypothetical protein [Candidatus Peribacteraceae bacterium]